MTCLLGISFPKFTFSHFSYWITQEHEFFQTSDEHVSCSFLSQNAHLSPLHESDLPLMGNSFMKQNLHTFYVLELSVVISLLQ